MAAAAASECAGDPGGLPGPLYRGRVPALRPRTEERRRLLVSGLHVVAAAPVLPVWGAARADARRNADPRHADRNAGYPGGFSGRHAVGFGP